MCFKTLRLAAIHNELKRTISTNDGLGLLQMKSEPDTGRCASEGAGPQGSKLRDPTSIGERTKHFL